jgi:uncharacterized membrane protein YcaP (DUF421 family)
VEQHLGAPLATLGWALVNALGIYVAVIVFTRMAGLRSFAKMSSFDFAMTVAVGSVIASTISSSFVSLAQGAVALAALYVLQVVVAQLRVRGGFGAVDNSPLLLMWDGEVIRDHLVKGQITEDDLRAKLREANVLHAGQVRAVVLETTGDVSVLHGEPDGPPLDPELLQGVVGIERVRG